MAHIITVNSGQREMERPVGNESGGVSSHQRVHTKWFQVQTSGGRETVRKVASGQRLEDSHLQAICPSLTSDIWSKTNFLRLLPANNYCQVWDYEKLTVRHFPSVNKTPWPIKWVSEPETGSAVRSWLSWWLNVVIRDCCDQPRKWLPPNEHLNGKLVE